jgi:hypothetical protein
MYMDMSINTEMNKLNERNHDGSSPGLWIKFYFFLANGNFFRLKPTGRGKNVHHTKIEKVINYLG